MAINEETSTLSILLYCSLFAYTFCDNTTLTESDLHKILFKTYNPDIMPVLDKSNPIDIGLEMFLMSIDNIDEKKQTIAARAFLQIKWRDEFLVWKPDDFGGVSKINVQNKNIWIPDISLDDTFDNPMDLGQDGGRANVFSDGSVTIWPYKVYTVSCKIYIAKFPFDEQNCIFDFLSWTNPAPVLNLSTPSLEMSSSYYTESGEWDLVKSQIVPFQRWFANTSFDHLSFHLKLRRKWLFQVLNMIAPIVCISLLNTFCFLLPAESGERVTLCISIFLTLAVFLTVVNSSMPESSDEVAVFGVYIGLQLVGSALAILMTVISIYLFYKPLTTPVPCPFRLLTKLFCALPNTTNEAKLPKNNDFQKDTELIISDTAQNGRLPSEMLKELKKEVMSTKVNITWVAVSCAIDRLCFFASICWHVILAVACLISVLF